MKKNVSSMSSQGHSLVLFLSLPPHTCSDFTLLSTSGVFPAHLNDNAPFSPVYWNPLCVRYIHRYRSYTSVYLVQTCCTHLTPLSTDLLYRTYPTVYLVQICCTGLTHCLPCTDLLYMFYPLSTLYRFLVQVLPLCLPCTDLLYGSNSSVCLIYIITCRDLTPLTTCPLNACISRSYTLCIPCSRTYIHAHI